MATYCINAKDGKHQLIKIWDMWLCSINKVVGTYPTFEKAEEALIERLEGKCPICTKAS